MMKPCLTEEYRLQSAVSARFERQELAEYLDEVPLELWDDALLLPLREFFERPRKDFRAGLVVSAWELGGGQGEPPAAALLLIEALHAGSLIVDDIQDRSNVRRGRPALHLTLGEPLAINAANWLYFYAGALAGKLKLPDAAELGLRRALNDAVLRCHLGQALDLGKRMGSLPQRRVATVVRTTTELKTGSLLDLAARLGAILAGADPGALAVLSRFGVELGVGLQMLDDLSGLYNVSRCHKGHEDLLEGRPTWPWAWLAEQLDELGYSRIQHSAREVERGLLHPEAVAAQLRDKLGDRPVRHVRLQLEQALSRVLEQFGDSDTYRTIAAHVAELEASYA